MLRTTCLLLFFAISVTHQSCSIGPQADPHGRAQAEDQHNYHEACVEGIRSQIRKEFEASLQYLLMGAYFAQDDVNLAGFTKMFFEHADEERGHGIQFIEYLRHRGDEEINLLGSDPILPILGKNTWADGEEALRDALEMEKIVSGSIKKLIDVCDNDAKQDYHAADWLTGTFLEEQFQGQRHLAGLINSLSTFRRDHEHLADWMFSNSLLAA